MLALNYFDSHRTKMVIVVSERNRNKNGTNFTRGTRKKTLRTEWDKLSRKTIHGNQIKRLRNKCGLFQEHFLRSYCMKLEMFMLLTATTDVANVEFGMLTALCDSRLWSKFISICSLGFYLKIIQEGNQKKETRKIK